jgi:hypothetical protein
MRTIVVALAALAACTTPPVASVAAPPPAPPLTCALSGIDTHRTFDWEVRDLYCEQAPADPWCATPAAPGDHRHWDWYQTQVFCRNGHEGCCTDAEHPPASALGRLRAEVCTPRAEAWFEETCGGFFGAADGAVPAGRFEGRVFDLAPDVSDLPPPYLFLHATIDGKARVLFAGGDDLPTKLHVGDTVRGNVLLVPEPFQLLDYLHPPHTIDGLATAVTRVAPSLPTCALPGIGRTEVEAQIENRYCEATPLDLCCTANRAQACSSAAWSWYRPQLYCASTHDPCCGSDVGPTATADSLALASVCARRARPWFEDACGGGEAALAGAVPVARVEARVVEILEEGSNMGGAHVFLDATVDGQTRRLHAGGHGLRTSLLVGSTITVTALLTPQPTTYQGGWIPDRTIDGFATEVWPRGSIREGW